MIIRTFLVSTDTYKRRGTLEIHRGLCRLTSPHQSGNFKAHLILICAIWSGLGIMYSGSNSELPLKARLTSQVTDSECVLTLKHPLANLGNYDITRPIQGRRPQSYMYEFWEVLKRIISRQIDLVHHVSDTPKMYMLMIGYLQIFFTNCCSFLIVNFITLVAPNLPPTKKSR